MRNVLIGFGLLVAVLAVTWIAQGNDFFMFKVFAPRYEATRRQVFEQSKAYNQGLAQELDGEFMDYQRADASGKQAIATVALHQVADYDTAKLPAHLRSWIDGLRGEARP